MAAKVIPRPRPRGQLQTGTLVAGDSTTSRLLSDLGTAVDAMKIKDRTVVVVTLAIGANKINHGLGRQAQGATVTPTVADATFAWALTATDDKQVTITTVGVVQPKATVEIY